MSNRKKMSNGAGLQNIIDGETKNYTRHLKIEIIKKPLKILSKETSLPTAPIAERRLLF